MTPRKRSKANTAPRGPESYAAWMARIDSQVETSYRKLRATRADGWAAPNLESAPPSLNTEVDEDKRGRAYRLRKQLDESWKVFREYHARLLDLENTYAAICREAYEAED